MQWYMNILSWALFSLLPLEAGIFGDDDTEINLFSENLKSLQSKESGDYLFTWCLTHFLAVTTNFRYIFKKKHI